MKFSKKELAAMCKMAETIALADGNVDEQEVLVAAGGLVNFCKDEEEFEAIANMSEEMSSDEMCSIISAMNKEQKKYTCGYMASVMVADEEIDEKEIAIWRLMSTLLNFPEMSLEEAIDFWADNVD